MNTPQDLESNLSQQRPWYKEGWMWLVVGIPVTSIFLGLAMIYFAVTYPHSMVSDDYYKEGLAINRELGFDRKAREWELKGELSIRGKSIALTFKQPMLLHHQEIEVKIVHPTLAMYDQITVLSSTDQQHFVGFLTLPLEQARYAIHLVSKQHEWRLRKALSVNNHQAFGAVDAYETPF